MSFVKDSNGLIVLLSILIAVTVLIFFRNRLIGILSILITSIMSFFKDPNGLIGLLSILITATILTLLEMVLFYNIIVPDIENTMNNNLNKISTIVADKINESIRDIIYPDASIDGRKMFYYEYLAKQYTEKLLPNSEILLNAFNTFRIREKKNLDKLNTYTVMTGGFIILFLLILMAMLIWQLSSIANSNIRQYLFQASGSSVMTVLCLAAFQYYFYLFGKDFNFPGKFGNEELMVLIGSNIKESI